jgi:hypothetical protein
MPQTAAIPNIAEKMPPVSNIPAQPSGEMRNSVGSPCAWRGSNTGAGVADKRIGVKARLTSTEGMTNNVNPDGSPAFSSAWPR